MKVFNGILMLVVIVFTPTKTPIGIKMCERQCQYLKGCYAIQYDTNSLKCLTLTDPKNEVKGPPSVTTHKNPGTKNPLLKLPSTCLEGEQKVVSRSGLLVCVLYGDENKVNKAPPCSEADIKSSWLLTIPRGRPTKIAFKLNLLTQKVERLPFFWTVVMAIATLRNEKKYLIVTPYGVLSSPMSSRKNTLLWPHMQTRFMCLDAKRKLVFLARVMGSFSIHKKTTTGRKKKSITRIESHMLAMEIDSSSGTIYAFGNIGMISIDYEGRQCKSVLTLPFSDDFSLIKYDVSQAMVYSYIRKRKALMRVSVRHANASLVLRNRMLVFPCYVYCVLNDGVLYMGVLPFVTHLKTTEFTVECTSNPLFKIMKSSSVRVVTFKNKTLRSSY